ncbi:M48 family metalloprotease [Sphingomonas sp. RS2018]
MATGSAVDRAGLRVGDVIVAVDGERFQPDRAGKRATFEVVQRLETAVDRLSADGALSIEIERDGARRTVAVTPDRGCPTRFDVRAGGATDASANGRYVQVGSDLVQSLTSDDDLAALLAHEIAHNILGHPQLLDRIGKGLLPGLGKSGRQIRATETAADRMSLYILTLSGYRIDSAIAFWDRFTRANDWGIFSDGTHPSPEARAAALRLEAARIAGLQAAGAPIVPPADLLMSPDTSADRPPAR